jgi:hypothetical protein
MISAKKPLFQTMEQWSRFIKKELRDYLFEQAKLTVVQAPPRD